MLFPNPDILVYIAMGDAFAAAVEYLKMDRPGSRELLESCLFFDRYYAHPTHGHAAGHYTDDAERATANTHVLVAPPPFSSIGFVSAYLKEFERGGRRKGYAKGYQAFLESCRSPEQYLREIRPDSNKNGGAMGAAVFGVLPTPREVLEVATVQARVTHATPEGEFAARLVALLAHFALYVDAPLAEAGMWCRSRMATEDLNRFGYVFTETWPASRPVTSYTCHEHGKVSTGVATAHACLRLVMSTKSLLEVMERILRAGGDTDSVAAIVWGIVSCRFQNDVLPEFFERDLEGGNPWTGAPYLREVGRKLMTKYA